MNVRISFILLIMVFFSGFQSSAQEKIERQHRIKKTQFPSMALDIITQNSTDVRHLKFYQEVDTAQKTFTAKFKRARLFYEIDFDQNGDFKSMGFNVKQVDIPEESFGQISGYLAQQFEKSKIRKMLQLYHNGKDDNSEKTINQAFQNLIIPEISYELLVRGKKEGKSADYKIYFDSQGNFKQIQKSLPANYDRVLY